MKKFIIILLIVFSFAVSSAQDFVSNITLHTTSIEGSCATTVLLDLLSNKNIHYDPYWFHTEYLGQPTLFDFESGNQYQGYKSFEELALIVPQIQTVYTQSLYVIDNQIRYDHPIGLYLQVNYDGVLYGHTVTIYGSDNYGYYINDAANIYQYLTRNEVQNILNQFARIWIVV